MYLRKKMRIIIHINFTTIFVLFQFGLLHKKTKSKLWVLNNSQPNRFLRKNRYLTAELAPPLRLPKIFLTKCNTVL